MNRFFLPVEFVLTDWKSLEPYYQKLADYPVDTPQNLKNWLRMRSEVETVVSEEVGWRYIKMTCDTANEELKKNYDYYLTEIDPHIQPYANLLDKKLLASPAIDALTSDADKIMVKSAQNHARTFREENIPLLTEIQQLQVQYGAIVGNLTVTINGEELTLQKAANQLLLPDRNLREQAYYAIQNKRSEIKESLNHLFNQLITKRHQVAVNAGFSNFRDYMFVEMCRFDYTPADCKAFHEAIEKTVMPIIHQLAQERKNKLGVEALKPWDLAVDKENRPPLKPFAKGNELIEKTIACFRRLSPDIAEVIINMQAQNRLDVESRKGKAPGGYNYPLYETGYPFIFMNSVGALRDLVTMVHEGGHALHSVLTHPLELINYKSFPSEVAELASMSMELLSMEHWDVFFSDSEELKRAKAEHLEQIIETLPWVATIDAFQHWLYENPQHTEQERTQAWNQIHNRFISPLIDWKGQEHYKDMLWQKQLHVFEVPFYYIEYGMAQLGAIAVWKNVKSNPQKSLADYVAALRLGYTKSISEIYATAGIKFDFSTAYIAELMDFVKSEWGKVNS